MQGEKFTLMQYNVNAILGFIEAGQFVIPEIQRPFVWKRAQVRDLIDSLYNGYPTGYIITWKNPDVKTIMLDTNVLISALLFPGTKMDAMMNYIFTNHQLVLSSYVVDELKNVVRRKFPGKEMIINKLLMMMSFEYVYTPGSMESGLFNIRDIKDYPVLYTAIIEDVDILVTGDKDFSDIDVEKPKIMSPTQFMENFLEEW